MEDNTYNILGDLILGPPDFDYKSALEKLNINHNDITNDEIASEHYSIFGMSVFPYGHYYLSEARNFAGDFEEDLIFFYSKNHFAYQKCSYGMGPTHLGTLFKFLGFTLEKKLHHTRRDFIAKHLLNWYSVFSSAINETNSTVFKHVIQLAQDKFIQDWLDLNGPDHLDEIELKLDIFDIHKDLLENERAGLSDIGNYLITPAYCGVFLSKATILNIASTIEIPIGFGDRSLIINDLLREASNYDVLAKLTKILNAYFEIQLDNYSNFPIKKVQEYWCSKIRRTQNLLTNILKTIDNKINNESISYHQGLK